MRKIVRNPFPFLQLTVVCALAGFLPATDAAEYISDELRVELRSGPSNGHRIVNFLPAGTRVEVMGTQDVFTQVRTDRGTEGWVPSQHITNTPSARDRLRAAEQRIETLQARTRTGNQRSNTLQEQLDEETQRANRLDETLADTRQELEQLKAVSANAIEAHNTKLRLEEMNVRLRDELEDLAADRQQLAENMQRQWLLMGAGLIVIGLVLGVLIKSRPRRSAWS